MDKPALVFLEQISEDDKFTHHNVECAGVKGVGLIEKSSGRRLLTATFIGNLTAVLKPHLMDNFLDALNKMHTFNAERINDAK